MSDADGNLDSKKTSGITTTDEGSGKTFDNENMDKLEAKNTGENANYVVQTAFDLFKSNWVSLHETELPFDLINGALVSVRKLPDNIGARQERLDIIRQDIVRKFVTDPKSSKKPLGRPLPSRIETIPEQAGTYGANGPVGADNKQVPTGTTNAQAAKPARLETPIQSVPELREFGLRTPLDQLSFEDGVLALSSAASRNAEDPYRLAALLVHQVGPFLSAHDGQISGENLVDGAVNILANIARQKAISAGMYIVVPSLRAQLNGGVAYGQADAENLSGGEIVSLAAIGTLLANSINGLSHQNRYEKRSVVYYHQVLLEMLKAHEKSDLDASVQMDLILQQAANNIAAAMGRMQRRVGQDTDNSTGFSALLNDLMMLSASINPADRRRNIPDLEKVAKALGLDKQIESKSGRYQVKDWFSRLSAFEMVSHENSTDVHGLLIAWRHAATGMLRAANGGGGSASAALFNGGVQILRNDGDKHTKLRIILNGCGVVVALKLAKSVEQGLYEFDGDDCAVNLLGSISALVREPDTVALPVPEIANVAASVQDLIDENVLSGNASLRIQNSIKSILEALPEHSSTRRMKLADATLALLRVIGRDYGVTLGDSPYFSELAGLVRAGFDAAVSDDRALIVQKHPEFERDGDPLAAFVFKTVQSLLEVGDNPRTELAKIYREKRYGTETRPVAEIGPLVAAGLSTIAEWEGLCATANQAEDFTAVFKSGFGADAAKFGHATQPPSETSSSAATPPVPSDEPGPQGERLPFSDLSAEQLRQLVQLLLEGRASNDVDPLA